MPIVREILSLISKVARAKGISEPYICGGLVRDKILEKLENIEDIDITTGSTDVHDLAKYIAEFAREKYPGTLYQILPDGHAQIRISNIKIDFSTNFNSPEVDGILSKANIPSPTSLQKEMFSRDFTCNSLLLTLDLQRVKDPTTMGIKDLKNRILRTPLPPSITLGDDNKRVVRVIYLSAKLGFGVEPAIVKWIKEHSEAIMNAKEKYVRDKLSKSATYDAKRTAMLIGEMGLWDKIPIPENLLMYRGIS